MDVHIIATSSSCENNNNKWLIEIVKLRFIVYSNSFISIIKQLLYLENIFKCIIIISIKKYYKTMHIQLLSKVSSPQFLHIPPKLLNEIRHFILIIRYGPCLKYIIIISSTVNSQCRNRINWVFNILSTTRLQPQSSIYNYSSNLIFITAFDGAN